MFTRTLRSALALVALAAAAPLASAQATWTVGAGPGFDFPTIQGALGVAGPFDLVDVSPGNYAAFTMSAPARIMGRPGAAVSGTSTITGIPAGSWALLADIQVDRLVVRDSSGSVILDDIVATGAQPVLRAMDASDLRIRELTAVVSLASSSSVPSHSVVHIEGSRVQLDSSTVRAGGPRMEGDLGQSGVHVERSSFVHVTDSSIQAGRGGDGVQLLVFIPPGEGGTGLHVSGGSSVRVVGSTVRGGAGGLDNGSFAPPWQDAAHGSALSQCGGASDAWDSTFTAGTQAGSVAPPAPDVDLQCGATLSTATDLPSFVVEGTPTSGQSVDLVARAGIGSSLRLLAGRFPEVVPVPGTVVPRLVHLGRLASLGAVPPSGAVAITLPTPSWPRGSVMFLQVSRTGAAGTDFSNGIHYLVR